MSNGDKLLIAGIVLVLVGIGVEVALVTLPSHVDVFSEGTPDASCAAIAAIVTGVALVLSGANSYHEEDGQQ